MSSYMNNYNEFMRRNAIYPFWACEIPTNAAITFKSSPIIPSDIKLVNFNEKKGVTTIKWADDTITQVRVQTEMGDTYNPEMGMAMCIAKKALGNKGNFNEVFKKWLPKEDN